MYFFTSNQEEKIVIIFVGFLLLFYCISYWYLCGTWNDMSLTAWTVEVLHFLNVSHRPEWNFWGVRIWLLGCMFVFYYNTPFNANGHSFVVYLYVVIFSSQDLNVFTVSTRWYLYCYEVKLHAVESTTLPYSTTVSSKTNTRGRHRKTNTQENRKCPWFVASLPISRTVFCIFHCSPAC